MDDSLTKLTQYVKDQEDENRRLWADINALETQVKLLEKRVKKLEVPPE